MSKTPVITFDYDFSPYGQKIRLALTLANTQFQKCDQPAVLPRPTLEALGITYRRIPLLAIGKDVFCDSSLIMDAAQLMLGRLPKGPYDKAYETYGNWTFQTVLPLIPDAMLSPEFIKDREAIFPILKRPDFDTLRPSALGEFKSILETVNNEFLTPGPFISGPRPGAADVHIAWVISWTLTKLGLEKEKGFGADAFPKVYKWISSLPTPSPPDISPEDAQKAVLGADYTMKNLYAEIDDPLDIPHGTAVNIESTDATPGAHPQFGKLVSFGIKEVVIELDNGIRLHFPRTGYVVRKR